MTALLTNSDPVLAAFAEEIGADGPIAIEGKRTRWDIGGALHDSTRVLRAPAGVVEYVPEEMTVTVRAGTPVNELQAVLAADGQRTGLPERGGTVGGAIAVGHNDHRMLGRGAVRTSVLQVRYVSAEGRLVSGGGPTVKNVTGFDLPRLMAGSLGTLGCLAEFILRTNPVPAVSQWYCASDADPFLAYRAVLAPSAVLWDGAQTWAQLEGHGVDVASQAQALRAVGSFTEADAPAAPTGHRWSLRPSDLASIDGYETGAYTAVVGVGTVFAEKAQPQRRIDPAIAIVAQRVKDQYDPLGRLNPGRQVGGW
jgi:FAD/FMN-containing dehydrogenase